MEHNDKLHNWSTMFLIIGAFIAFMWVLVIMSLIADRKTSSSSQVSADGFTIEGYDVILNVNENNTVDVEEHITVYFYESGHHGIYRTLPEWLEYTGKDNNTISRKAEISNLICYTDNYSISSENGKTRIKMGNANRTLSIGEYTYVIGYTYDMGEDPYDGFDEFIFHAIGDYWGTTIKEASIEINLPETIDITNESIHFFADKYRIQDITSYVDYFILDNTIYAELSSDYSLNSALTIDIELPEGYFVNESNNYGYLSLSICIICIVFAIISFLLWVKNGKDLSKVPETVEFYPPDELDAAQVGYLYKRDTGKKLTIALIVELASKGFLRIIESPDKTKQTILRTNYRNIDKRKHEMTKNEEIVYNQLFRDGDETVLSENDTFYTVFGRVSRSVKEQLNNMLYDSKGYKSMLISSIGFALGVFLLGISYIVIEDLNTKLSFMYDIAAVSNAFTLIFSIFMRRKNSYGEQLVARIKGFRNYLESAEKNQIDMLAEENPNYFYDILPYAYVLGVSKKWIEKFEDIPTPVRDMGNFNYCDISALDALPNLIYNASSGSSSCGGGGCSSCGGGCSSCGGGGSW